MPKKFTYIDLFAGCGGLSLGLHNAGWKGIFAIEKSRDAFSTLKHNLIDNKNHFNWPSWLGEPTNLEIDDVLTKHRTQLIGLQGQIDLIAGGPPCQGFSSAGRRKETDYRNDLVGSYIEFINLVKPKMILFENVKGFTQQFKRNKEEGKLYSAYVEDSLVSLGYIVKGKLVNFGDFGIPQKRTRFILVGVREDLATSKKLAQDSFFDMLEQNKAAFLEKRNLRTETTLDEAISDLLQSNGCVPSPDSKGFRAGIYSSSSSSYQTLMRLGEKTDFIDSHRFVNHTQDIVDKFEYILKYGRKNKNVEKEIKDKFNIRKHTVVALDKDDKCPTITTLPDDYIHYQEPRILTAREYARIQSFPDWYQLKGKYTTGGKVRTQEVPRYTQIGNAIPPLFGEQSGIVLKQLLK